MAPQPAPSAFEHPHVQAPVTPSAPQPHPAQQPEPAGQTYTADPQPAGYPEPQRRTNWGLIIPIVLVCLALLGGGGYFGYKYYTEKQAWTNIVDSNKFEDFQQYLNNYPFGSHRDEAQARYKELKQEYDAWVKADKAKNFSDYSDFVREYPDSRFYTAAVTSMDSLAWDEAMHIDTPEAYALYVNRMPKGLHVAEAVAKADNMKLHELSEFEEAMAVKVVNDLFEDIEYGNDENLLMRFPAEFKFMAQAATKVTILNYVHELRDNASYLNIKVSDCRVTKNIEEGNQFTYSVDFNVDYHIGHYDGYSDYDEDYEESSAPGEGFISNTGTALVDANGMVLSLIIRRVAGK